jgi:hypothetical protein
MNTKNGFLRVSILVGFYANGLMESNLNGKKEGIRKEQRNEMEMQRLDRRTFFTLGIWSCLDM